MLGERATMRIPNLANWWTIAGMWTLIAAWTLDACISWGNEILANQPGGLHVASLHVASGTALYLALEIGARLGLAPVVAGVGICAAVWLTTRGRHAAASAVAFVIAFVLAREHLVARHTAIFAGFGIPLAMGLSRISLGVHNPIEVVAQWSIGADIALGIVLAYLLSTTATTRVVLEGRSHIER